VLLGAPPRRDGSTTGCGGREQRRCGKGSILVFRCSMPLTRMTAPEDAKWPSPMSGSSLLLPDIFLARRSTQSAPDHLLDPRSSPPIVVRVDPVPTACGGDGRHKSRAAATFLSTKAGRCTDVGTRSHDSVLFSAGGGLLLNDTPSSPYKRCSSDPVWWIKNLVLLPLISVGKTIDVSRCNFISW